MVIDPKQAPIQVAQVDVDAPDSPPATLARDERPGARHVA